MTGREIVDHPHAMTIAYEALDEVGTDEASATGDEQLHCGVVSFSLT